MRSEVTFLCFVPFRQRAHALERLSGKLKNGQQSDVWLRATSGIRKMNGKWLIVHDHISVPTDFESGKALLDLKP
jgi:hypothetical protein